MEKLTDQLSDLFLNWPLIVFVLSLNILGKIIKNSPLDNRFIPVILAAVGGASCHFVVEKLPIWSFFNTITHVWFGIFIGYGAVGIHQQLAKVDFLKKIPFLGQLINENPPNTPPGS